MRRVTSIFTFLYVLSGFFPYSIYGDCIDRTDKACCCGSRIVEAQPEAGCCSATPESEEPLSEQAHACFCNRTPYEEAPLASAIVLCPEVREIHFWPLSPDEIEPGVSFVQEVSRDRVPLSGYHPPPVRIQLCSFRL